MHSYSYSFEESEVEIYSKSYSFSHSAEEREDELHSKSYSYSYDSFYSSEEFSFCFHDCLGCEEWLERTCGSTCGEEDARRADLFCTWRSFSYMHSYSYSSDARHPTACYDDCNYNCDLWALGECGHTCETEDILYLGSVCRMSYSYSYSHTTSLHTHSQSKSSQLSLKARKEKFRLLAEGNTATDDPIKRVTRSTHWIGRSMWNIDEYFEGTITYLRFWHGTAFTDDEVTTLYMTKNPKYTPAPTNIPSTVPFPLPSSPPSAEPTLLPSGLPSSMPSSSPTQLPTLLPSRNLFPTTIPSPPPTVGPTAADLFSVEISLVVTATQCPSEEDEQILRDTVIAQSQCDGASLHDVTLTCDSTVSQSNFFTFAILYLIILIALSLLIFIN